jgi:hypothetical protein
MYPLGDWPHYTESRSLAALGMTNEKLGMTMKKLGRPALD